LSTFLMWEINMELDTRVQWMPIPREHYKRWYSIFKNTSGRFIEAPVNKGEEVRVSFEIDSEDYRHLNECYRTLTTNISETKPSFLKKLKLRLFGYKKGD